jgi:hypothetical protein
VAMRRVVPAGSLGDGCAARRSCAGWSSARLRGADRDSDPRATHHRDHHHGGSASRPPVMSGSRRSPWRGPPLRGPLPCSHPLRQLAGADVSREELGHRVALSIGRMRGRIAAHFFTWRTSSTHGCYPGPTGLTGRRVVARGCGAVDDRAGACRSFMIGPPLVHRDHPRHALRAGAPRPARGAPGDRWHDGGYARRLRAQARPVRAIAKLTVL